MANAIPVNGVEEAVKNEVPSVPAPKKKSTKIELRDNQGPPVPGEVYKLPDGTVVRQN